MTKGLLKLSNRKQKLYDKFLKSKTNENEEKYKTYKCLLEILYYSRKLDSCKQNMNKMWDTIKEDIDETKTFKNDIQKSMVIDGIETFDQNKVV